jgi:hypothetical protein
MLQVLDGVFSFILFDYYFENEISKIYIVSDICGIIPLYSFIDNKTIYFTENKIMSENKILPGCYSLYELSNTVSAEWNVSNIVNKPYFLLPNSISINRDDDYDFEDYEKISNKLWKCLKNIVLKIIDVYHENHDIVNDIVDELFSYMGNENDKQKDIVISNETLQKEIVFSSKHFFIFNKNDVTNDNSTNDIFEYDIMMRKKIYSTVFELDKKYPFFDKSFIMLYLSIPLSIRCHDVFLLYESRFYTLA